MPELTMDLLAQVLNAFRRGDLSAGGRFFEIMTERDGELGGVKAKRQADVSRLPWEIESVDDSPEAQRHAEALRYAYGNLRTTHAIDQDVRGGVRTLINQMVEAHSYRYSVHEMRLRVDNPAAREVTLELTHCPVWWFEARLGRLRYLPYEGAYTGIDLEDGQWLRAVGHGVMRPLSVAFLVKWLPMSAWLLYTQRFGVPGIHGETDAKPGTQEWADFEVALVKFANDWVAVTNAGAKINLVQATGTADAPFSPLIDYVDRLYGKLYRGGDLSTSSRDNQAVGASLQFSESDAILQDDASWVTETLNEQVDRPFIRYVFGTEPKAWFRLNPPRKLTVDSDIKAMEFLVRNGVRVAKGEATERLGFREADKGEDILTAAGNPPADNLPPDGSGAAAAQPLANEKQDLATRALAAVAQAASEDMAPVRAELERISGLTSLAEQRTALFGLMDLIPDFARTVLKSPKAAGPLGDLLGTAYVNGLMQSKKGVTSGK